MITMKQFENGYEYIEVQNDFATAKIGLQGAHLFHFQGVDKEPLLWVSNTAVYREGKAIRGGIPVCWPWFGPHKVDSTLPQHGFARISRWEVTRQEELEDGSSVVVLALHVPWEYAYSLTLQITVGETLDLSLTTENKDVKPFEITQALHSYYNVFDIEGIRLEGLDGCSYLNQLDGQTSLQHGTVTFNSEVDRVYDQPAPTLLIQDMMREVSITSEGSGSVVVWNPWT
ncbi:MAG TPA: D-hexose-6-phosphate mutarotase, partial [Epsilonproteobacteria bacterium]|nr:D-hexose-6-phosphate mutarotase [Campylobacterota bacterium]